MIDHQGLAETGRSLQAEDETSHQKLWRKPEYCQEGGVHLSIPFAAATAPRLVSELHLQLE
jgi:hypothetical protein